MMYEETKHITARLQVLEYLMTQANLADLFRHTDILLFVMYAQNVAEGVTTQYQRMVKSLDISFYVSFPFDEWLRKIQNWKEKLIKPEFQLEHDTAIGEGRAARMRILMEKLCNRDAAPEETPQLEHPYNEIARKPYHEAIVDLAQALDTLKANLSNLAMLPLKTSKENRSKALQVYLGDAEQKESVQSELQDYTYYCSNKRNQSVIRQLLYFRQRILALVGQDELADLDLAESEQQELLSELKNIFEESEINPADKHIPAKASPRANDELFAKVLNFIDLNAGPHFPVLDEENIVDFLVRKDVTLSDGEEKHIQTLLVLMKAMCRQLDGILQTRFDGTITQPDEIQQRIDRVLKKVGYYNARLLPCMESGKTVADLNDLFARWFSSRIDVSLREPQLELLRLLEDGLDRIKMETYVHLLREASDLNLFKNLKPVSDKLYAALSKVQSRDDEAFPISGPSFNKYFRNPDFCKEDKWQQAAKVLQAVRKALNPET
ncbi:MAG: hypothetical protein IJK32_09880 [Bacteroidales bacterium]|nr:hypothetical protein [Bacteroidales bacterium]